MKIPCDMGRERERERKRERETDRLFPNTGYNVYKTHTPSLQNRCECALSLRRLVPVARAKKNP